MRELVTYVVVASLQTLLPASLVHLLLLDRARSTVLSLDGRQQALKCDGLVCASVSCQRPLVPEGDTCQVDLPDKP